MKYRGIFHDKVIDGCGIVASVACLLHCLALPMLYILFPAIVVTSNPWFTHSVLALFVLPFAGYSLLKGIAHQGSKMQIIFALVGGALILAALSFSPEVAHTHFELDFHTTLTVVGSIFLVVSHIFNLRSCKSCCTAKSAGILTAR